MAYARRRRYARRTGRRGTRTLSTRSIFNNKGAKAQAGQISALKKRLSYVYRQCRPETKVIESPISQSYLPYDDPKPYVLYSLDMPLEGVGDNDMTGNVINIKDVHLYLNSKIDALSSEEVTASFLVNGGVPITMDYRIVLFGLKSSSDTMPDLADILQLDTYSGNYSGYHMNAIRPFNAGASSVVKIFYDRRFSLATQGRTSRSHVLTLKGRQIYKFTRDLFTGYSKGRLYALIVPVLNFESNLLVGTTPIRPAGLFDMMTKYAYTDP